MSAFASRILGLAGRAARSPIATLAGADVLGYVGSQAPSFVRNLAYRASGQAFNDEINSAMAQDELARSHRARLAMLLRARSDNEARLAAMDPHTYSELMAGQRLPPGAVVIGGRPDRSLVDEVTLKMAMGDFGYGGDGQGAEV